MNKRIAALFLLIFAVLILPVSAGAIGEKMNAARGTPEIDGVIDPIWKKTDRQKDYEAIWKDMEARGKL